MIPIGISIDGLNDVDKLRISQIGLWRWMDEICEAEKIAPRKELPVNVLRTAPPAKKIRLCRSGSKCLKSYRKKPAAAKGQSQYCSSACGASDRARAKRAGNSLEAV